MASRTRVGGCVSVLVRERERERERGRGRGRERGRERERADAAVGSRRSLLIRADDIFDSSQRIEHKTKTRR